MNQQSEREKRAMIAFLNKKLTIVMYFKMIFSAIYPCLLTILFAFPAIIVTTNNDKDLIKILPIFFAVVMGIISFLIISLYIGRKDSFEEAYHTIVTRTWPSQEFHLLGFLKIAVIDLAKTFPWWVLSVILLYFAMQFQGTSRTILWLCWSAYIGYFQFMEQRFRCYIHLLASNFIKKVPVDSEHSKE